MTIQDRILQVEQKFKTKQSEREQHLKNAESCLEEMHRFQGQYSLLSEMQEEEKPVDEASTITAEPAKEN